MPDEHSTTNPKRAHRPRRWVILLLCATLVGYIGWRIYDGRVREYKFVALYPLEGFSGAQSCNIGFLLEDPKQSLVFYDWHGREQWRITKNQIRGNPDNYMLAADGRTFGMIVSVKNGMRLQQWRDGKCLGEVMLPSSAWGGPRRYSSVRLGNTVDGRSYFWYTNKRSISLIVIKDGRVTGRGSFSSPDLPEYIYVEVAPDLSAMIASPGSKQFFEEGVDISVSISVDGSSPSDNKKLTYFTSHEKQGRYSFTPRFKSRVSMPAYILRNGIVLTNSGKIIDARGIQRGTRGFRSLAIPETIVSDPYLALHTWNYGPTIITSLTTRDTWTCPLNGVKSTPYGIKFYDPYTVTPDGQYVLFNVSHAQIMKKKMPESVSQVLQLVPYFGSYLRNNELDSCIALFERPGKLRARLPFTSPPPGTYLNEYWEHLGQHYNLYGNFNGGLSADGRALVMVFFTEDASGKMEHSKHYAALFRW